MPVSDRRTLIQTAAAIPLAMATSNPAFPQAAGLPAGGPARSAPTKDVTGALARYLLTAAYGDLPGNVRKEGVRTLMNWTGVAIGGSRHQTVEIAVAALAPFSGPAQTSLLGRRERFDIMNAAFINGVSSHIFDFDDTHLENDHSSRGSSGLRNPCARGDAPGFGQGFSQCAGARCGDGMPDRRRRLPQPLRRRLAHHRHSRRVRIGCRGRQAHEPQRTANGLGAWPRGVAAGGVARVVRLNEQELQSRARRQQRHFRGAVGVEELHLLGPYDRSQARLGEHGQHQAGLPRDSRWSRQPLRDLAEHLQAVCVRNRDASGDRRRHPIAQ